MSGFLGVDSIYSTVNQLLENSSFFCNWIKNLDQNWIIIYIAGWCKLAHVSQ
jgi:hypothetical protein